MIARVAAWLLIFGGPIAATTFLGVYVGGAAWR